MSSNQFELNLLEIENDQCEVIIFTRLDHNLNIYHSKFYNTKSKSKSSSIIKYFLNDQYFFGQIEYFFQIEDFYYIIVSEFIIIEKGINEDVSCRLPDEIHRLKNMGFFKRFFYRAKESSKNLSLIRFKYKIKLFYLKTKAKNLLYVIFY